MVVALALAVGLASAPFAAASGEARLELCPGDDPTCTVICGGQTIEDLLTDPRGTVENCLPA